MNPYKKLLNHRYKLGSEFPRKELLAAFQNKCKKREINAMSQKDVTFLSDFEAVRMKILGIY